MNETRGWAEGAVIYFDDSFEHEVRNNCASERVVFQVVFVHPDLSLSVAAMHAGRQKEKEKEKEKATGRQGRGG